jgi:hypothetical protein
MDTITLLAALAPLGVDLGKSLISRFLGQSEFKPSTVEQWLQMRQFDLQLFETMNNAGGANPSYPWVEAIVRLQRPAVAGVALSVWAWSFTFGQPADEINNFASAVGFYLFGDRTLFYIKQKAAGK